MKTFNSFFKSANAMTTLAIVAIALTSVFGFTSCDKNDDAFNNSPITKQSNPQMQAPQNNKQTIDTQAQAPKDSTQAASAEQQITFPFLAKVHNYNFIGTWEYTDNDGKTYVLNVTEETKKDADLRYYAATLTIDGVEYEGEMTSGLFKTIAKSTDNTSRLCGLCFTDGADKPTDTELVASIRYDKKFVNRAATFKKVSATTNEVRARLSAIR